MLDLIATTATKFVITTIKEKKAMKKNTITMNIADAEYFAQTLKKESDSVHDIYRKMATELPLQLDPEELFRLRSHLMTQWATINLFMTEVIDAKKPKASRLPWKK